MPTELHARLGKGHLHDLRAESYPRDPRLDEEFAEVSTIFETEKTAEGHIRTSDLDAPLEIRRGIREGMPGIDPGGAQRHHHHPEPILLDLPPLLVDTGTYDEKTRRSGGITFARSNDMPTPFRMVESIHPQ